jgi:hypothetical protein
MSGQTRLVKVWSQIDVDVRNTERKLDAELATGLRRFYLYSLRYILEASADWV